LPGNSAVGKAISFALLGWFFRVLMAALSQGVSFELSLPTVLDSTTAGLLDMLALGLSSALAFESLS
jgi:hypothetical protein